MVKEIFTRKLRYMINSFFLKFALVSYSKASKEELETIPKQIFLILQAIRLYPD